MKNLLNSPTDGNMSSIGNPMQQASRAMNNTSLYGSLSGSDDNATTYKQPYKSAKGDCGCNGPKRMRANNQQSQMPPRNYPINNQMPNPRNNPIPYPPASRNQNLQNAYPSKVNSQSPNSANNQMNNPLPVNK